MCIENAYYVMAIWTEHKYEYLLECLDSVIFELPLSLCVIYCAFWMWLDLSKWENCFKSKKLLGDLRPSGDIQIYHDLSLFGASCLSINWSEIIFAIVILIDILSKVWARQQRESEWERGAKQNACTSATTFSDKWVIYYI